MNHSFKLVSITFLVMIVVMLLLMACDDKPPTPLPKPKSTVSTDQQSETITIGNYTDMTGVASTALQYSNMALEDMVAYYNDQNLIPNIEFHVIHFDGQYNPANNVYGYEWLKDNGADVIFSSVPLDVHVLKSHLLKDDIILFLLAAAEDVPDPSEHIYPLGDTLSKFHSYTLLKWIAENDPDFPKDRPAKIGGASWMDELQSRSLLEGAQEYAKAHPEQFEWIGGYLTEFTFIWDTQVESLRDCDYVLPPVPMEQFVSQYRAAGYEARFIGCSPHIAFLQQIHEKNLWDVIDGMWVIKNNRWWNEESEMIDLINKLLHENHADDVDEIIQSGIGYLAAYNVYMMLELIADAVENSSSGSFNSQAVRDAAQSFTLTIDGIQSNGIIEANLTSSNCLSIYEAHGDAQDLFRIRETCCPIVREIE